MKKILFALISVSTLFAAAPSMAGSWDFGCVGNLPSGQQITFDRGSLIIMPEKLASGKPEGVAEGSISTYTIEDPNSGLESPLSFKHEWAGSETATVNLVFKSKKVVSSKSETVKCSGTKIRDISRERSQITYEITGYDESKPATIKLECYDYMVSACG